MTVEEWNKLRAGMRIVDHHHGDAIRTIIKISRVKSENGRGLTRTGLTVTNLKSNDRKAHTIIFASENTGPSRFDFPTKTADGEHDTSCSCCKNLGKDFRR
jgi:hypothetical protein